MKRTVLMGYGIVVVLNGVYRYLTAPDGMTGLIFGAVMGAMALAAGLLGSKSKIAMYLLALLSIAMTGGFFAFVLIKEQAKYGVIRSSVIVLCSVIALVALLKPQGKSSPHT
ncbi:hypothetical protein ACFL01_02560 [Planctomycetota bacterium]